MPPSDYEQFRQQADERLLANLRMVYDAYLVEVRAYETLALARGVLPTGLRLPVALDLLAAGPERLLLAAGQPLLPPAPPATAALPAGEVPAALPPAPPAPAPAPAPAPRAPLAPLAPTTPARRKASAADDLYDAILAVLDRLDDTFSRQDLLGALPFKPRRSTLYAVLQDLIDNTVLELAERGRGATRALYRKRRPVAPG
ncbi:MAG TPA: hypothetical protein VEG34_02235 [Thermoanaerobaculia bacterium]|nr:hypothetical protein [Thermoanaerobaculia bacterium]